MNENLLYGHILKKNLKVFQEFKRLGFDYIVNPETGELHKVVGGELSGSHNLAFADIENFVGLANLNSIPIHWESDGALIPVYDWYSGLLINEYSLNKCKHCFPES